MKVNCNRVSAIFLLLLNFWRGLTDLRKNGKTNQLEWFIPQKHVSNVFLRLFLLFSCDGYSLFISLSLPSFFSVTFFAHSARVTPFAALLIVLGIHINSWASLKQKDNKKCLCILLDNKYIIMKVYITWNAGTNCYTSGI